MLSSHHQEILKLLPQLPDSAKVPMQVAAAHDGVSVKTVRRNYPLVKTGDRKLAVPLSYLRHSKEKPAA
jgi:hypothetical protein